MSTRTLALAASITSIVLGSDLLPFAFAAEPARPTAAEYERLVLKEELQSLAAAGGDKGNKARDVLKKLESSPITGSDRGGEALDEARRIVNGIETWDYPASGALLVGADKRSARLRCSGTIISCDRFITAAHCFIPPDANSPDDYEFKKPEQFRVYLQHSGIFEVESIDWPGDARFVYPSPTNGSRADVAIVKLKRPAEGIMPMPLKLRGKPPKGSQALIIGFGRTGGWRYDYGVKRIGGVIMDTCTQKYADELLCWSYSSSIAKTGENSNTCNGDSGGGLHIDAKLSVAGVTSGGLPSTRCLTGDHSYNTAFDANAEWLDKILGDAPPQSSCGTTAAIDVNEHVFGIRAYLDNSTDERVERFEVRPGTAVLRVAMNGTDDGSVHTDFNLYLIAKDSTDTSEAICREDGPGQFAVCEVKSPPLGAYTAVVRQKKGNGWFQLVVTRVPEKP